jgi:two-component system cell cycle sensor histidine kinase/response regulator CckA
MYCKEGNKANVGAKLLVIDDDETTCMLIRETLDDTDIGIIETGFSTEAFDIFKNHRDEIGLVLLDICLPGCNGWTLIGMIRQLSPQITVIAISAMPPAELAEKCRTAGFNGYVSKPFDLNQLKQIILSYLYDSANR